MISQAYGLLMIQRAKRPRDFPELPDRRGVVITLLKYAIYEKINVFYTWHASTLIMERFMTEISYA